MGDLLVKLYDLPDFESTAKVAAAGIDIRRALAPERYFVIDWVRERFSETWAGEVAAALSRAPVTCWVAVKDGQLLGFACADTSALGFFGPTGVAEEARHQGIGEALLHATLAGMREAGHAYAIIGDPGPIEFYRKRLDAIEIPGSKPGIYKGMLRRPKKT